jgi:hypothetical protein
MASFSQTPSSSERPQGFRFRFWHVPAFLLVLGGVLALAGFGGEVRVVLASLAIIVFSVGLGLWAFPHREEPLEMRGIFQAAGLGLGGLGLAMLGLAAIQQWNDVAVWTLFSLLILASAPNLPRLYRTLNRVWEDSAREEWTVPQALGALLWVAVAGFLLLYAFLPPMGFDGLEYHLGVPWAYWQQGGMTFLSRLFYSNFPMNIEMALALGWRLGGEQAFQVFHCLLGLLTAAGLFFWISRQTTRGIALLGALVFLTDLQIMSLAVSAKIDLGLVFFSFLAFESMFEWWKTRLPREAILSGVFCGLAVGCKYSAIGIVAFPVGMGLVAGLALAKAPWKEWRAVIYFGLAAACLFTPWAIRNAVYQGNPVFPLAYSIFGGKTMDGEIAQFMKVTTDATWPEDFQQAVSAPSISEKGKALRFALTQNEPLPGFFLVLLIPLLLSGGDKRWRAMAALVALIWLIWLFLSRPIPRYLLPAYPCMIAVLLLAWEGSWWKLIQKTVQAILLLTMLYSLRGIPAIAAQLPNPFDYMTGRLSREEILFRGLPHFQALEYLNRSVDPARGKVLLVAEARGYGCKVPYDLNSVYDHAILLELLGGESDASRWANILRAQGYTHLLFNQIELARYRAAFEAEGWKEGGEIEKTMALLDRAPGFELVFATPSTPMGRIAVYRIEVNGEW